MMKRWRREEEVTEAKEAENEWIDRAAQFSTLKL